MRPREALEPALGCRTGLGQRDHALGCHVVDDVQVVRRLGHHLLVAGAGGDVHRELGGRLAEAREGRALPVLALLPEVPVAVGVVVLERVGPQADRRVELEGLDVGLLLEDVLGHDEAGAPAHREQAVEARVRLLEVEDHGVVVRLLHAVDIRLELAGVRHARGVYLALDRVDQVVGRELHAVAPVDALAELHRHLGEVLVVDRLLRRERVFPDAVDARVRVDPPESVEGKLLQAGRRALDARPPAVEIVGRNDAAGRVLEDQRLCPRNSWRDVGLGDLGCLLLGPSRREERSGAGREHEAHENLS